MTELSCIWRNILLPFHHICTPSPLSASDRSNKEVVGTQTAAASCSSAHTHTRSSLFNFKVSHNHTHTHLKQRHYLRHTQLHPTAQTHKQIKPPSVTHTPREPTFHSYADRNLVYHPLLLFSSKFTGLINTFYIVNMADCVWYTVSSTHNSRLSI